MKNQIALISRNDELLCSSVNAHRAVLHMRLHVYAPAMTAQIVNSASVEAFTASPQNAYYAATKAVGVSLTKSFCAGMRQGSDRCQFRRANDADAEVPASPFREQKRYSGVRTKDEGSHVFWECAIWKR
ncbi:NADP-dependent 3-hydroxy acid dehydrogenase YdfG [Rhizobium sp. BK619]|nr:NADP-dependent 3-hydroxy acid dehydrogenase YdfG [Rhizobium sp. BK619]